MPQYEFWLRKVGCSTCPPIVVSSHSLTAAFAGLTELTAYSVTVYGFVQNNSKTAGINSLQFRTRIHTGGGGDTPPPSPPGRADKELLLTSAVATGPTTGRAVAQGVDGAEFDLVS